MLSLPEDWDYSLNGLNSVLKENETAIKSALEELKEHNYLNINKERNQKGLFEYIYNIYEFPHCNPGVENPDVDYPGMDYPVLENQTQINTNKKNINNQNICSLKNEQISFSLKEKELADNFDKIWQLYPRKDGKNTAFNHYKAWLSGKKYAGRFVKLTNKQMWLATKKYADLMKENKIDKQYIKMGSTFFNESILEYVEE